MNFKKLLSKIDLLFRKSNVPYMLVGGFAVAYWGYPRQSLGIDVVSDLMTKNLDEFLNNAKKLKFSLHKHEIELILKKGNRFVMELDDFRIDCWLPKTSFEKEALLNRKRKKLFGRNLYIIGPEDLILSKLLIGRARDIEDIKTILIRQGKKINKPLLNKRAAILNVAKSLSAL